MSLTLNFPPTAVHVWQLNHNRITSAQRLAMQQTLDADELERQARFHFAQDREKFGVSRGGLRLLLGGYLSCNPARLRFVYNEHRKPTLVSGALHFNVSHSGSLILYAIAHAPLGIDVEEIDANLEYLMMAKRFFSARETAVLHKLPSALQAEAFFCCWTRKEAYLKALGTGLTTPLDSFDVAFAPDESPRLLKTRNAPADVEKWRVYDLKTAVGYKAALVADKQTRFNGQVFAFPQELLPK